MNWNQEQYQQLTEHYRDMSDAELLHLAKTPDDLTDLANEVLQKELTLRGLSLSAATGSEEIEPEDDTDPSPEEEDEQIDREVWRQYMTMSPPECTFDFPTEEEALRAALWLSESGIKHGISGTRIAVRPNSSRRATALLSQPIPNHIVIPAIEEEVESGDFIAPTCPNCNASDPMLIAIEPTNRWLCESCEHEWDDPEPA